MCTNKSSSNSWGWRPCARAQHAHGLKKQQRIHLMTHWQCITECDRHGTCTCGCAIGSKHGCSLPGYGRMHTQLNSHSSSSSHSSRLAYYCVPLPATTCLVASKPASISAEPPPAPCSAFFVGHPSAIPLSLSQQLSLSNRGPTPVRNPASPTGNDGMRLCWWCACVQSAASGSGELRVWCELGVWNLAAHCSDTRPAADKGSSRGNKRSCESQHSVLMAVNMQLTWCSTN